MSSTMFDLTGKVAVVTGGSRGIGRAIAEVFARSGAYVVIASRKLGNCEETAERIRAETGRRSLAVDAHVGHWADCDRLVDTTYREFGRCDILVNNAGMSPLYERLDAVTEEYFDKVTGVNLKGPFRLASLMGARMAQGDRRLDHQRELDRLAPARRDRTGLRLRQGGPQRAHDRPG